MAALDRRTFLRGIAYGLLGAVLGWEIEAIAATEAAPEEEEHYTSGYMHTDHEENEPYTQVEATISTSGDGWTYIFIDEVGNEYTTTYVWDSWEVPSREGDKE